MSPSNEITVYSGIACPFSHRTRMALEAKGVSYDIVEIDLMNPPDWFRGGPPRTRMPKLVTGEVTIYGASVADEYVDERWPDPPLLTGSAAERAEARQWIDWLEEKLQPAYETALLEVEPARFDELRQKLDAVLHGLEDRLQERGKAGRWSPGSYWHGERLGMVDLTYAATMMRFAGLRKFHRWEMPAGLPAVSAWIDTLGADPIVQKTFFEEKVLELVGTYRDTLEALSKARAARGRDAEGHQEKGGTGS